MRLRLPAKLLSPLQAALTKAGSREVGGQLFGEQLAVSDFLISEIAIQARPGTVTRFFVDLVQAGVDAMAFHQRTGHQYRRFNYLGEWHSHPSFPVEPSGVDTAAMRDLTTDPDFAGTFAILMIARLDPGELRLGAWVYDLNGTRGAVILEIEA
jgi:proteasome lid subunit RPN8/RPN11